MTIPHGLWAAAAAVATVNVPFGYWRARTRRFSLPWFAAVHVPVPLVVVIRLLLGVGWRLSTLPVLAAAFLAGQLLGGLLRRRSGDHPS